MENVPSRNAPKTLAIQSAGCPRCGATLDGTYKYCPNCSYRLRPDLARVQPQDLAPASTSHRLLALGGFLGFCALLLLVVFTGMRLFDNSEARPTRSERRINFEPADVRLSDGDLRTISGGEVAWGVFRPGGLTGELDDIRRALPDSGDSEIDWAEQMEPILEALRNAKLKDTAAALEALEQLAIDQQYDAEDMRDWAERVRETLDERGREIRPELFRIDDEFSISVSEVTQEQWYAFLVARARRSKRETPRNFVPRYWRVPSGDALVPMMYAENHHLRPVTDIDPAAALEFCNWIWEEQLGGNPDVVVDLPTYLEMARAGRGGSYDNFPWGAHLSDEPAVLTRGLRDVREAAFVGRLENGIYALIGNAAEWVHFGRPSRDEGTSGVAAAGWSYLDSARRRRGAESIVWQTPFSTDEVEPRDWSDRFEHIGFRFVVRPAPSRPSFLDVTAGPVQFTLRDGPVIPPSAPDDEGEMRVLERVTLPAEERFVAAPFAVSRSEITNRQYLLFLTSISGDSTPDMMRKYSPYSYQFRSHPLAGRGAVYLGPFGNPEKLPWLFEPGRENHPVQGITDVQALAYASWLGEEADAEFRLPTAAEFIRAGRGDRTDPYPWGDDTQDLRLICAGRADDWGRAVSMYRFLDRNGGEVQGLCGNLLELVRAPGPDTVYWLAGGCFQFPPEACTLDDFLPYEWSMIFLPIPSEESIDPDIGELLPLGTPKFSGENPIDTLLVTGFRVVREERAK